MERNKSFVIFLILMLGHISIAFSQIYMSRTGDVTFISEAPLEFITASSDELSAAINFSDNEFAFMINNKSLIGFNSALQQEHFYENYIETDKYKSSTFQGKIIEKIDLKTNNIQKVRAKGLLSIHGAEQERIIKATIQYLEGKVYISSEFEVPIEDHNIRIPNIVHQKIAETILVKVQAELTLKTD